MKLDTRRGPLLKASKSRTTNEIFSPLATHPNQAKSAFSSGQKVDNPFSTTAVQPKSGLTVDALKSPGPKPTSPMSLFNRKAEAMSNSPMIADTSKINSRNMDHEMTDAETMNLGSPSVQQAGKGVVALGGSEHAFEVIRDEIEDFRDELMSENFRFKAEMLKEFMQMKVKINLYVMSKLSFEFFIFLVVVIVRYEKVF